MSALSDDEKSVANEAYAVVGEIVLMASALDERLNEVIRLVCSLPPSPFMEPIIGTIDSSRKIEILRNYAGHITASEWKIGLRKLCDQVEKVNKARNTACHSALRFESGSAVLINVSAGKLLKNLHHNKTKILDLKVAIRIGEEALAYTGVVVANFAAVEAKLAEKRAKGEI
ncbi:hypothetical protein [Brevundimonas sp. KM4]|uniref:hypothetical protein n=1 Tax=Brevundimonas sp. KM4 TaxID=1628191 RepID=UPI0012DFF6B9|nr:hypothetical protein [Brevundimonas sp. KM4]